MIIKKKALAFICLISVCFTCAYAFDFNQPQSPTLLAANPSGTYAGASADPSGDHYRANISIAGSTATVPDRTIYYIDGIFPLYYSNNGDSLLFFAPKQNWFEPYALESNMGLGFRKIMDDRYILGMHLFYDNSTSPNFIAHQQTGVGAEFLSEPLDVRVNYYHPNDKAETVDTNYEFSSKNLVVAKKMEEAMEGYDVELGGPIYPLNALNTRTYLGGFAYKSTITDDVNGFRFRTESKLNDFLNLDLSISSGKTDTEFTGGLRAVFPLDLDNLFALKNPTPLPSESLPYLKNRMFERVVRDLDIQVAAPSDPIKEVVTQVNGVDLGEMIYVKNTAITADADGTFAHPWTTLADAFGDDRYVGKGGAAKTIYIYKGDGTTTGYARNNTLDDGVTLWGSGYNGGLKGLPVFGQPSIEAFGPGNTITLGNNDTVQGLNIDPASGYGIYANNVTGGTIRFNTIDGNANGGILIEGGSGTIKNFNITNNVINENGTNGGILIANAGAIMSGFNISGNTIVSNGGPGIGISELFGSMSGFNITGNTIASNDAGIAVVNYSPSASMTNFAISGNTIASNEGGGLLFDNAGNMSGFTISGNTISSNKYVSLPYYGGDGISVFNQGNMSNFSISGNTISSNEGLGIYMVNEYAHDNMNNFTISGNTISSNIYGGVLLDNFGNMSAFDIAGNAVISNPNTGVELFNRSPIASMLDFNISNNNISTNEGQGLYLDNEGVMLVFDIANNHIASNEINGVYIYNQSTGQMSDFAVAGNTMKDNGFGGFYRGNGMEIYNNNYGTMANFNITGNTVSSNRDNGVFISNNYQAAMENFAISGNTISSNGVDRLSYNGDDGLRIENYSGYMTDFNITGNTLSHNGFDGAFIYNVLGRDNNSNDTDMLNFNITGNTIAFNGANGLAIVNYDSSYYDSETANMGNFTISGNTIASNSNEGMELWNGFYEYGYATMANFNVTGNTISSNKSDGVYVFNDAGYDNDFGMQNINIANNTINANDGNGISVSNEVYSDDFIITGNTVSSNGTTVEGNGIQIFNDGYMYATSIVDNTIEANTMNGVDVNNQELLAEFGIFGNTVSLNGRNGVNVYNDGGMFLAPVYYNTISSNAWNGINIDNEAAMGMLGIGYGDISSNGRNGVNIYNGGSMDIFGIGYSIISSNKANGVTISNSGSMTRTLFTANTIEANAGTAASIIPVSAPHFPTGDGIFILNTGAMSTLECIGNDISRNAGTGIDIVDFAAATAEGFDFLHNVIAHNSRSGASLEGTGFSDISFGTSEATGGNNIFANGSYDITNDSNITDLPAQYNYWGGRAGNFGGTNTVSAEPFLTVEASAP